MRKLIFGLCLVMVLFGLSGCLFVYSQGPDCAVFGVYEPHYHVPFYDYPPYPPPFISPMPTATGDGITGNGAGSLESSPGGTLLGVIRGGERT